MRSVLITRPRPAADDMAEKLAREGFTVFVAPMTRYEEIPCDTGALADYQAIVLTSAQAAQIFAARAPDAFDTPVFAVGDATALAASNAGFRKVYSAQGDGLDVVRLIRERKDALSLQKILHPCAEDTAQDITAPLAAEGIAVVRKVIYKAQFVDTLSPDISQALAEGDISTVTLFSARTAANFARLLQQEDMKGVSADLEAVCLSERVAAELSALPWRAVRTAKTPQMEAVFDILRAKNEPDAKTEGTIAAEPVIAAFGGLRPLATRLDITASTVQGWRKRGVIPAARVEAVFQAAAQDGIALNAILEGRTMTDDTQGANNAPQKEFYDRRTAPDERRQKHSPVDRRGNVVNETYSGKDRRSGIDRRAYHERQAQRIRDEKWRFVNGMIIKGALLSIAVLYAGALLLAPELKDMKQNADQVAAMQARIDDMNRQLAALQMRQAKQPSLGNKLSNVIGSIEGTTDGIASTAGTVANVVTSAAQDMAATASQKIEGVREENGSDSQTLQSLQSLLETLSRARTLQAHASTRKEFKTAMKSLRAAMASSDAGTAALGATLDAARKNNPALAALLQNVSAKDLGAAALLLALNEFRNNVNADRPYAEDLALLQKYAGDDPEMQKALARLAPYAEHGVLNPAALREQFQGLASDIVMAKLQGQDLSIKQEMLARLGTLVKVRKIDDISGDSVDAKVARAQLMLDKGDVQGALAQLQTLEGAPAQTAAPFIAQAEGTLAAGDAANALTQLFTRQLSGQSGYSFDGLLQGAANDSPETLSGRPLQVPYMSPALQQNGNSSAVFEK